jgi:glutamate racemase
MRIGVFDSGKGGRLVAERLKILRPNDDFTVVNDRVHLPYGSRTPAEIIALTEVAIRPIINHDVVVIACNTATACAIDFLRKRYPEVKFVGFEPMLKPAVLGTASGEIVVLATPTTLKSPRYAKLKAEYAQNRTIYEPNCATWAEKIEKNAFTEADLAEIMEIIAKNPVDQVILACTHYLALENLLRQKLPPDIKILQPIAAINRRIDCLLQMC